MGETMTAALIEKVARSIYETDKPTMSWDTLSEMALRDGYINAKSWRNDHISQARAALSAIEEAGWVVVPIRDNANFITGRAPLDVTDIESVGAGALYVDGLTLDEAGALIRQALSARPRLGDEE
jgi:hypothetical protein